MAAAGAAVAAARTAGAAAVAAAAVASSAGADDGAGAGLEKGGKRPSLLATEMRLAAPVAESKYLHLEEFQAARALPVEALVAKAPRKAQAGLRAYYTAQNELIDTFEGSLQRYRDHATPGFHKRNVPSAEAESRAAKIAINLSFAVNVALFAIKIVAAAYSGSLAVIASAIDSSLDLASGSIIWVAARIAARRNPYHYPVGKTRMEPLAIVVFASVMGVAALQICISSVQEIIAGVSERPTIKIDALTYGILGTVIGAKAILYQVCRIIDQSSVQALAQDHRNDVITNSAAIIAVGLASHFSSVWWLDPAMAILLAALIIVTWALTGKGHIQSLTGKAAEPQQLSALTYVTLNHDPRIECVDTVRAYYAGTNIVAEVDVVLPRTMPLHEAHDIGESLQTALESLDGVERAYVHLDTEFSHSAHDEHMSPW